MAIYFAPKEETFGEGFGKAVGGSLAQGISQRMQRVADMKMQEYAMRQQMNMQQNQQRYQQQQQRQNNFQALSAMLPNMSEQDRISLSTADPAMLSKFVTQKLQQEGNVPLAQFMFNALGGQQNQPTQGQPPQDQQQPAESLQGVQPDQEQHAQPFQGMQAGQPKITPEMLARLPRNDLMAGAKFMQKGIEGQQKAQRALTKEQQAERVKIDERYRPQYNELRTKAQNAKETNLVLQSMLGAAQSGNLPSPQFASFAEGLAKSPIGDYININAMLGPEAEVFVKNATKLFSGAKAIFGSRITNLDFSNFLQSIPRLTNSDEGKKQIIQGIKLFNDMYNAEYDVAKEIEQENDGYLPKNFNSTLEKRVGNRVDELGKQFLSLTKFTTGRRFDSDEAMSGAPEGTRRRDNETGQIQIRQGGKWINQ